MKHHPNCAVVRAGDLKAWCDCAIGERNRVLERLRYSAKEFRYAFADREDWMLVAEILEEEADVIERNEH